VVPGCCAALSLLAILVGERKGVQNILGGAGKERGIRYCRRAMGRLKVIKKLRLGGGSFGGGKKNKGRWMV